MDEYVILIDEQDQEIGTGEKIATHVAGKLHRAFSVVIFNTRKEMLLQKRAEGKYHSPGLWSNTCCGHPRPDEDTVTAARRRLQEEMGFDCELQLAFTFHYQAHFDNGLMENELDHVMLGYCDHHIVVQPDPEEAGDWRWIGPAALREDVQAHPDVYTYWFKVLLDEAAERGIF